MTFQRLTRLPRSRLTGVVALASACLLAVWVQDAGAQGGTAKPPGKGTVAPWVEPTLADPAKFSVDPSQIHGFDSTGFIQQATVDKDNARCPSVKDPAQFGGTVTINNTQITVPCNLTIQMPANTFTWAEFINGGPDLTVNGGKPNPSFEVRVVGNTVGKQRIAGLMFFSQQSVNSGEGSITSIDYTHGRFTLDTGTVVELNDPVVPGTKTGRYSAGQSPDPRLSVDQGNPTVKAATGYPMCIPRVDETVAGQDDSLCPKVNRPLTNAAPKQDGVSQGCRNFSVAGVAPPRSGELAAPVAGQLYCTQYVMPDPATRVAANNDPDARQQVPFAVGDHVSYAGTLVSNSSGGYISAHTVNADVAVYTQPGTKPAYISIESSSIGSADPLLVAVSGVRQETKDRLVLEASTTDVKAPVDIYLTDINPSTGAVRNRWVSPFEMTGENQAGNPSGGITTQYVGPQPQRARLRATLAPAGLLSNPTRTLRVSSRTTCVPNAPTGANQSPTSASAAAQTAVDTCLNNLPVFANGLQAGMYTAPMFDFIFPENVQPGTPIVPNDLWHLGFLRFGEGPNPLTPTVGPLTPSPW